jgi:hypothetical protein
MRIKSFLRMSSLAVMFALAGLSLFTLSCKKDDPSTPDPKITSVSPSTGGPGTLVTITGEGFSSTAADLEITFGTAKASITAASPTVIVVQVPSGVTNAQSINVKRGGGTAAKSPTTFNVVGPAVLGIASFSPGTGTYGTVITIIGTAFDATLANNVVKFGSTTTTVLSASTTSLVVAVPTGAANGKQKISVTVGGSTVTSTDDFTVNSNPEIALKDSINANTTDKVINWTADKRYLLNGFVYVPKGVTLNIAAGTIIKGVNVTAALIVEPGATINAIGTAANPIIFTSNLPAGSRSYGNWGGVLIAGTARVNLATATFQPTAEGGIRTKYGSNDAAKDGESSGKFQYVRIEFCGYAVQPNSELNGLTLAGVGSGTTIDHVQVSFINDDGFEWFGGAVDMKYIISHRSWDDDFDTDNGYSGRLQFGIGTRDNSAADQSGSKAFESDNSGNAANSATVGGTPETPLTTATFSNFTLTGPAYTFSGTSQSLGTGVTAVSTNYVTAAHFRRSTSISIYNSVFTGWNGGLLVDFVGTANNAKNGTLVVKNNVFAGINKNTVNGVTGSRKEMLYISAAGAGSVTPTNTVAVADSTDAFGSGIGPNKWFNDNGNKRVDDGTSVLEAPFAASSTSFGTPNFLFKTTYTPPAATFTDAKVASSFFNKVTFIGAVGAGADNWSTEAWIEWNPNSKTY